MTAGPTQEPIDPVRFVTNRSSGKMGFAIARAAWRRGASVRIVAGPSALATPYGVERIDTVTAAAMLAQTSSNFPWSTALVMAAAVADFRPANPAVGKIGERRARASGLRWNRLRTRCHGLRGRRASRILIGFAAETDDLEANARAKLKRKGLDLIVANDVTREGAGFEVDTNIVTLIGADGHFQSHPQMSKDAVADLILIDRRHPRRKAEIRPCGETFAPARRQIVSMDASSLDRRTLVATIRDYVEQLREEGMEGLPASTSPAVRAMPMRAAVRIEQI